MISVALKRIKAERDKAEKDLQSMADVATAEHAKVLSFELEMSRLHPLEQELCRSRAQRPAIQHYLGLMPRLIEYAISLS
jgi:hypothetical protein